MSEDKPSKQSNATSAPTHDTRESLLARIRAWWRGGSKPPVPEQFEPATIGDSEKSVVRVIAFSAGGVDNVFEFGMVHAFLISHAPKPHIVAGTSSGAVVAAMLADVLQAGEAEKDDTSARWLAQVARFRGLLDQIQQLPGDFKEASWPDFTEVSARAGLVPLNSPTQQPREKEDRNTTAIARFGITRLVNGMLSSRLKIRELTRIVRLGMELQALKEARSRKRSLVFIWLTFWTSFCLWLQILVPAIRDAPLLLRCILAPARERLVRNRFFHEMLERLGVRRLRDAKTILFEPWYVLLGRAGIFLCSYPIIALSWLFAPPAVIFWLWLNRLARGIPIGTKRALVLRLLGFIILFAATVLVYAERKLIHSVYAELGSVIANIGRHNITSAFKDWQEFRHGIFRVFCFVLSWVLPGLVFAAAAMAMGATSNTGELLALFLDGFGIKKDLLTTGVLNKLLMRAFDPYYFGKRNFSDALNEALAGRNQNTDGRKGTSGKGGETSSAAGGSETDEDLQGQRTLADWIWKKENKEKVRIQKDYPILVAPVATDIAAGKLLIIEPGIPTVEALGAACALTPLFAARKTKFTPAAQGEPSENWLVDGACIAREPIQPALDLIKRLHLNSLYPPSPSEAPRPFAHVKLIDDPSLVDFCIISPYPTRRVREQERRQMAADMTENAPSSPPKTCTNWDQPGTLYRLSEILALRATHSAKDERILVTMYNAVLRQYQNATGKALFCSSLEQAGTNNMEDWHISANLRELEPEKPIHLATNLARCADESKRRALLLGTIADGCRASLKGLFRNKLNQLADKIETETDVPPCRKLQNELLKHRKIQKLPGILDAKSPPGITEICRECRFYADPKGSWEEIRDEKAKPAQSASPAVPDWGEMLVKDAPPTNVAAYLPDVAPSPSWPRDRIEENGEPIQNGKERPLVSVIFSGGVFRGVFQVGVLNAFCMAGVKPDIVAGASVGTIMAALSARVFTEPDGDRRIHRIAGVAATFLAIDRLVLTDRFADFVRRLTLRAGSADFALRDADHLFRQFDRRDWELLARRSRQVLAGIHRLLSVDPVKLFDLLRLDAPQSRRKLANRIVLYLQDALNRAGIGTELLGAEPLDQLIKAHVLSKSEERGAEFDEFLKHGGIHFMATTTNLTTGELDVLGSFCNELRRPALVPGLLASSAFPGVFRPRMNWELRAGSPGLPEELVDGGIADNLPIIPVYRFLFYAGHTKWLKLRPTTTDAPVTNKNAARPHLLLTASLEPKKQTLKPEDLDQIAECWPSLKRRVGQLQYNVKVDSHRRTQADLRKIHEALKKKAALINKPLMPLLELPDLHVSCVKPEWLCGTFAFHPMLGFRRQRQAQSIAHGCASSLVHLYCEQEEEGHKEWTEQWWTPFRLHSGVWTRDEGPEMSFKLHPRPADSHGNCCFVEGWKCPFSKPELVRVAQKICKERNDVKNGESLDDLGKETIEALDDIYQQCGKVQTHRRPQE